MTNPWKRPHRTAQQRPKDRLKNAQLAPLAHGRVKCGNCDHAPGMHADLHIAPGENAPVRPMDPTRCVALACDCTGYVEVNG